MSLSNPKHKLQLSTTQMIALGFLLTVVGGSLLLMLPVSSADGTYTPFVDALFTSTTSVCVTGLVVVNTFEHWSLLGQIVAADSASLHLQLLLCCFYTKR